MLFMAADCNRVLVFVAIFLAFCCFLEFVDVVVVAFFCNAGFGVQASSFPTSTDAPTDDDTLKLSPLLSLLSLSTES